MSPLFIELWYHSSFTEIAVDHTMILNKSLFQMIHQKYAALSFKDQRGRRYQIRYRELNGCWAKYSLCNIPFEFLLIIYTCVTDLVFNNRSPDESSSDTWSVYECVWLCVKVRVWLLVWECMGVCSDALLIVYICMSVRLSVCLSVRPSVRPSVFLSVCLSVRMSVCLSVCLCACACCLLNPFIIYHSNYSNLFITVLIY